MRKGIIFITAMSLMVGIGLIGCKQKEAEPPTAVEEAEKLSTQMQPEAEKAVEEAKKLGEQAMSEAEETVEEAEEKIIEVKETAEKKASEVKETVKETVESGMQDVPLFEKVINKSKEYATVAEQVKYLIGTANDYLNTENFDMAIKIAQYVLQNLDEKSIEAQDIIEKAKEGLKSAAKGAAEGVMKDVKKKMGEFEFGEKK